MMVSKNVMWGILAVAAGAGLATVLMRPARSRRSAPRMDDLDERVDTASDESFPASDPPSQSVTSAATPGPVS